MHDEHVGLDSRSFRSLEQPLVGMGREPPMVKTLALTATSSRKIFTVCLPSTICLPVVPSAWKPTITMLAPSFQRLCLRWCLIRPAVHMPEPAMTMADPLCSLMAMDSAAVGE